MGEHAGDHESPEYASMYCLACDYVLDGLRSVACPECGCAFDPDDADSFRTGPVLLHDPVQLAQLPFERVPPFRSRLKSRGIRSAMHEERAGVIRIRGAAEMFGLGRADGYSIRARDYGITLNHARTRTQ